MTNEKLTLYGFNNLTKSLAFNIYDVCITRTPQERKDYINYIDDMYNTQRLTNILSEVTHRIGAHVLNISKQDYDPQGASVTILISEQAVDDHVIDLSCNLGRFSERPDTIVAHLDKSHITVHTYPESHPERGISTFRVDIDVSTCGTISPLNILDYLIGSFDSDIINVDFRVRGFTRLANGKKVFIDDDFDTIQDYIDPLILAQYECIDVNVYQQNIFHTKMMRNHIDLDNYLLGVTAESFSPTERQALIKELRHEMLEIYQGKNIFE